MYSKELHMFRIISDLWHQPFKLHNLVMCNLYTKSVKFLKICRQFPKDGVAEQGNILRPGSVPRFPDAEVIAISKKDTNELFLQRRNIYTLRSFPSRKTGFNPKRLMFET